MIVVGVDPGSHRTGFAVLAPRRGPVAADWLIDAGVIRPSKTRRTMEDRVEGMVEEITAIIRTAGEDSSEGFARVAIEIPSGKVGTGSRRGATTSLIVYGFAAGAIWAAACAASDNHCYAVTERAWTRGVPKARRAYLIAAKFPHYRTAMAADVGLDAADAIGLALWSFERRHRAWIATPSAAGLTTRAGDHGAAARPC